jgi:hypothetical protein
MHPARRPSPSSTRSWMGESCFCLYQCWGSRFIESAGSGSRVLMTKNWREKKLKNFFYHFFNSYWNLLFPISYLHKGSLSSRRSPQASKENIQHGKKWNLFTFSIFVGHFCPPGSGSVLRIRILILGPHWIRINLDPDPQHWFTPSHIPSFLGLRLKPSINRHSGIKGGGRCSSVKFSLLLKKTFF